MKKNRYLIILSALQINILLGISQIQANTNPENTLPAIETPNLKPETSLTVDQKMETDAKVKKILATKFMVNAFDVEGAITLEASEVNELVEPYEGRLVSVQEMVELAKSITALYQKRGYPLSYAFVPPQSFANNIVIIQAVEGYIGQLNLEGDYGNSEIKIREIVRPMLEERPLTQETLSRKSGLLKLVPGLSLQAYLPLPKNRDGAAELTIKAQRRSIIATGRLESLSPKLRGLVSVQLNSHSPSAEQSTFTTLLSNDNEEYYAGSYTQMIGSSGLSLKVDGSIYDGNSDDDAPSGLERDVTSLRFSTTLSYPIIADRNHTLVASVGFNAVNFDDEIRDPNSFRGITSKTNSRSLTLGGSYKQASSSQFRNMQLQLSKGIESLGAKKSTKANFSNTLDLKNPADLDFEKINLSFIQSNLWPANFGTVLSLTGQYSPDNLPVTERIQFGGFQYGRAFRPGVLFGDSGWGISAELNRQFPVNYDFSYFQMVGIQPYGLIESAKTFQNISITDDNKIRSLALGARLRTDVAGVIDVALAKSLVSRNSKVDDDLTFSFNFGFLLN